MDFTASMDVKNRLIIQEQSTYIAELEAENEFLKERNESLHQQGSDTQADLNIANAKLARIRQEAS